MYTQDDPKKKTGIIKKPSKIEKNYKKNLLTRSMDKYETAERNIF